MATNDQRVRSVRRVSRTLAEDVAMVHKFFTEEKRLRRKIEAGNVIKRVSACLDVSETTVKTVMREGVESFPKEGAIEVRFRERKVSRSDISAIRRSYLDFIIERKKKANISRTLCNFEGEERVAICSINDVSHNERQWLFMPAKQDVL
tara:strand:- start:145 stop:591 length:447 start_codon:yes stop_codon:yes gene_type:complete